MSDDIRRATMLSLCAVFLFSCVDVLGKWLAESYPVNQIADPRSANLAGPLIVLSSALCFALSMISVRKLSTTEST